MEKAVNCSGQGCGDRFLSILGQLNGFDGPQSAHRGREELGFREWHHRLGSLGLDLLESKFLLSVSL